MNQGWKGEHTIWKAFRSFPHVPFTKDSGWVTDIRVHDGPRTPNIRRISIEAFIFPIWNSSSVLLSRHFFIVSQTCYILVWPTHAVREGMETIYGTSRTAVVWSSWAYTYSSDRAWRSLKFMTCQKKVYMYIMGQKSGRSILFVFVAKAYTESSEVFRFFQHLLLVSRLVFVHTAWNVCCRHTIWHLSPSILLPVHFKWHIRRQHPHSPSTLRRRYLKTQLVLCCPH